MQSKSRAPVTVYRIISVTVLAFLLVVIFCLSAQTASESSELSGGVLGVLKALRLLIGEEQLRTLAHFCEFAALGFAAANAAFSLYGYFRPVLAAVFACVYSLSDEIHQIFVPGRAFQLSDLAVDWSGVVCGTIVCTLIFLSVRRRNEYGKAISMY